MLYQYFFIVQQQDTSSSNPSPAPQPTVQQSKYGKNCLTLYSIIMPLALLKYHVFENIMENGAFALLEQMLLFPQYFQKYSKFNFFII